MKVATCLIIALTAMPYVTATAQEAPSCPKHAEHMAASQHRHAAGVDTRGDKAMGFDHEKTTHHFLLSKDGGAIQVTANSLQDKASIVQIQTHLQHIAQAFTDGNFAIPAFVHDQVPPGVETMKRLKSDIRYTYEPIESGARVVVTTSNPEGLSAVHDFLRFQIEEHRTGDPEKQP